MTCINGKTQFILIIRAASGSSFPTLFIVYTLNSIRSNSFGEVAGEFQRFPMHFSSYKRNAMGTKSSPPFSIRARPFLDPTENTSHSAWQPDSTHCPTTMYCPNPRNYCHTQAGWSHLSSASCPHTLSPGEIVELSTMTSNFCICPFHLMHFLHL